MPTSANSRVSVVLTAGRADDGLKRCLRSLAGQQPFEIIVAAAGEWRSDCALLSCVRLLRLPQPSGKPRLLQEAIAQARGDIIVVTQPNCWFPAGWLQTLQRAHNSEYEVIGGAVEYGGEETVRGWAAFLADYGAFLPPEDRRSCSVLAGNHISFKRSTLTAASACWREGYVKTFLLWELERRGIAMLFEPALLAYCAPESGGREFARGYYVNARDFARERVRGFSPFQRLVRIVSAPLLPPLLLLRRVGAVWGKRERRGHLLRALPWLAVFVLCWSAGEFAGYCGGGRR